MGRPIRMTRIPRLSELMNRKGATINQLADAAGVSDYVVVSARKGNPVTVRSAGFIVVALETRAFIQIKKGPR